MKAALAEGLETESSHQGSGGPGVVPWRDRGKGGETSGVIEVLAAGRWCGGTTSPAGSRTW